MINLKTVLFIGPSATGKSYLANLPYKHKEILEPTVGIDYRVHRFGNTKYMIYDTGDLNRYCFIIKDYFPKVDEIYLFVNSIEDYQNSIKKLEGFKYKIVSDNTTLNPDFLLSFNSNDYDFYKNEESPLLEGTTKKKFCCW
jgi:GTPase SAR1 family protein